MSVQVRRRRESAAFLANFVGAQGELIVDTTNNRVQIHDGATPGGWPAARLVDLPSSASPLPLTQGGTGVVAASPAALAAALGLTARTTVNDAAYAAQLGDRLIAFTALSAARTVTLPTAAAFPTGVTLTIVDESGACSSGNAILVAAAGTDKVNGGASVSIATAYGYLALECSGAGKWTVIDSVVAGGSSATAAITGGTINGATIGTTTPAAGTFTTLAASGAVNLPANSLSLTMQAQAPTLTLRGNLTAATANVADSTLTAHIDAAFGTTRGSILFRGAAGWNSLAPGASGSVLTSNGSSADPSYQASGGSGGSSAPRSSVRQTVQAGPASGGAPSFLPATTSGLSITAQNVAVASPLTVAAANGFGATGQTDLVYQFTSNPAWSNLAASATNFLFVNASTGATSSSTLAPVYQFGNSPAYGTAAGQFTFDYQSMAGYLGNGTAAVATPLVCVGEAVTSASAVTSSVAYAYNGYYDSGLTAGLPAASTPIAKTANLGVSGGIMVIRIVCTTADQGYSVGDVVTPFQATNSNFYAPFTPWTTRNAAGFATGPAGSGWALAIKSSGGANYATAASWSYAITVRRPWGGA